MTYLFATDLDGTLIGADGGVGPATRAALHEARAAGVRIVFVTGRPPRWMRQIGEQTGHTGICVCANGAVVLDLSRDVITEVRTIPTEVGAALIRDVRARFGSRVSFAVERARPGPVDFGAGPTAHSHAGEFTREAGYRPRLAPPDGAVVETAGHLMHRGDVIKILVRFSHAAPDPDDYLRQTSTLAAGRASVTRSSSSTLLELGPAGVSKATGLEAVARDWGIARDRTVAAGDMPNDLPMLQWAGRAVAVESSHPTVLAVADRVVADPEHDGLAPLLNELADLTRTATRSQ